MRSDVPVNHHSQAVERATLRRENHERALRHALWLALLHAQELGAGAEDLQVAIGSILIRVDHLRARHDTEAHP